MVALYVRVNVMRLSLCSAIVTLDFDKNDVWKVLTNYWEKPENSKVLKMSGLISSLRSLVLMLQVREFLLVSCSLSIETKTSAKFRKNLIYFNGFIEIKLMFNVQRFCLRSFFFLKRNFNFNHRKLKFEIVLNSERQETKKVVFAFFFCEATRGERGS